MFHIVEHQELGACEGSLCGGSLVLDIYPIPQEPTEMVAQHLAGSLPGKTHQIRMLCQTSPDTTCAACTKCMASLS